MIDEFKVKEHNFITNNGNIYQILIANIENEIKSIDIDPTAPNELLSTILFDEILRDSKIKLNLFHE